MQQRLDEGADLEHAAPALTGIERTRHIGSSNLQIDYRTPLSAAAEGGHLAVVEALLQCGAKASGKSGGAAVRLASLEGHGDMVRLLAGRGAPLELTNGSGDTALSYAAREGHVEVVRALLELGAKTGWWSGRRARREAKGNDAIMQLLSR